MNSHQGTPKFDKLLNEISLNFSSDDKPFNKDPKDIFSDRKLNQGLEEPQDLDDVLDSSDEQDQETEDQTYTSNQEHAMNLDAIKAVFRTSLNTSIESEDYNIAELFSEEVDILSGMLHDMDVTRIEIVSIGHEDASAREKHSYEGEEQQEDTQDKDTYNIEFDAFFADGISKKYGVHFTLNNLTDETDIQLYARVV